MIRTLWLLSDKMGCGTYRTYFPALHLSAEKTADITLTEQPRVVMQHIRALQRAVDTALEESGDDRELGSAVREIARLSYLARGKALDRIGGLKPTDYDDYDVMVFQRAIGGPFPDVMRECQRRDIRTIVELDDNLWDIPRTNPAQSFWGQKHIRRDLEWQLDAADRVIVSTRPLLEEICARMRWPSGHHKIAICPNFLDREVWGEEALSHVLPFRDRNQVVIGWQGSTTHETDFQAAAPALKTIVARYPHVKLVFFGAAPKAVVTAVSRDRFHVVKGVRFDAYPATLKFLGFDIGIAPLTPCRFNDSKSNLKWMEYASLRVPCVASKVYPYAKSIDHGRTGFVAATTAEWEAALAQLVESADLRQQVGQAAYDDVWTRFSDTACGPAWTTVFQQLRLREVIHDPAHSAV